MWRGKYIVILTAIAFLAGLSTRSFAQAAGPELPRQWVDTTLVAPTGTVISVPAGGNFQAALNAAQPGDVIELQAGATFTGNFLLPNKAGTGWVYIRSSAWANLPVGQRVSPSQANLMARVVSANGAPAISTAEGAHHYRFIGIEFAPLPGPFLYNVVLLGAAETSLAALPHHIIIDRCYLHGDPAVGSRRGVALNGAHLAVIDSYLSGFKEVCCDSQALGGWNGIGPFKIVNNYLEGAGENLMFGGSDPTIPNLVPADIEIRRNLFSKPLTWKADDPSYAGTRWIVKNIFELKNARRILVDGNIFEHNWIQADQHGYAIVFTVRNQNGGAPWSVVEDVTFANNIVRNSTAGVNILGYDNNFPSQQTKRLLIKNNLFETIGPHPWAHGFQAGRLFQLIDGTADVAIDHNTAFHTGSPITGVGGRTHARFVFTNNIASHNQWAPLPTLNTYFPGYTFRKNAMIGGSQSAYPPDNFFPATTSDVGFVDVNGGNYRLASSSPYKNAGTDGKDLGADIDALEAAIAGTPDTTPPVVSMTSPSNGAIVSGTVTVQASATDNRGVVGVQFKRDGTNLGAEDTTAPYATSWDTTTETPGSHTLSAVARDAAGNTATSAPVTVTVSAVGQSPYKGTPWSMPGTIQAEDFDVGGEGVAYHDNVSGNAGGLYRTDEHVDIVAAPYPGGHVINNFETGEWLEYTINVTVAGVYRFETFVSSQFTTSRFRIEIDGVDRTGSVTVPNTGSWKTFRWIGKHGGTLTAGQHVLRIYAEQQYFNLDAIRLRRRSAYQGSPWTMPGTVQAEDFDIGGEGIAYHDNAPGNAGGLYRTGEDADIVAGPSGSGHVVNNFETGEWMEYTVHVPATGTYRIEILASSKFTTSRFRVEVDGVNVTGSVSMPATGSWQTFQWVGMSGISLTAGERILRLHAEQQYFNVDAIRVQ